MKPVTIEYCISREEWVGGLLAVLASHSQRDPFRPRMMLARLVGFILLIFLWQIIGWSEGSLFAAAILLPVGEILIQRFLGRRAIGSTFDPGESLIHLELTEAGVRERTANRERQYKWSGVRQIFVSDAEITFDLAGTDMLVVPTRALDAGQGGALDDCFQAHGIPVVRTSRNEGRAGVRLVEDVTLAKLAVAVAIVAIIVGYVTSGAGLKLLGSEHQLRNLLIVFGAALLAAAGGWVATRAVIGAAARRSAMLASALAWTLFALSTAAFLFGFLWR